MKTIFRNSTFLLLFILSTPLAAQFSTEAIKYTQFLNFLNKYYVDSVDTEKIVEEAIISQLSELDPHSIYISSEDVKKMNEPLEGNFEGIGIQFNILKDTLFVPTLQHSHPLLLQHSNKFLNLL